MNYIMRCQSKTSLSMVEKRGKIFAKLSYAPAATQTVFTLFLSLTKSYMVHQDDKNNIEAYSPGSMIWLDVQETETCAG